MAEATVAMVLTKLGEMMEEKIKDEISLHLDAKKEVEKLSKKLIRIQEVLADAELKGVTDSSVRSWLKKLQDIAYDIDNVLDEWEHQRLKEHFEELEQDASTQSTSDRPWEKVISLLQSLCLCFDHVVDRRNIAVTVRELNGRLDSVAEDNAKEFKFVPNLPRAPQQFNKLDSTSQVDEEKVKGRHEDVRILVDKLVRQSDNSSSSGSGKNPQVISVVGSGGMGKTTLAQLVFQHNEVQTHFRDMRTWICVSDPFDQTKIAKSILEDLKSPVSSLSASLESMLKTIGREISGKKFLLVLDDVWLTNQDMWEPLRLCLKKGKPGSKILVTTRNTDVARTMGCTSSDGIHVLKELSVSDCWSILSQIAFQGKTEADRRRLRDVGLGIAEKCKGMPLAAKVMGGLLRSTSDRGRWQSVLESKVWELREAEEKLFPFLKLSYNELDPVAKRCFSYCAIFPKDEEIDVERLKLFWMAQGFIPGRDASEVEFNAQKYFDDLAARSFFQDFGKHYIFDSVTCKMHDIVHDFSQFLTKNECLVIEEINNYTQGQNTVKEISCQNARHLNLATRSPISVCLAQNLRSFCLARYSILPQNLFNQLKRVRLLALPGCDIEHIPEEVGRLIHLRYLDLSLNRMAEVPETICDLFELQTLDLSGCYDISQILSGMEKLQNLRHLHNYDCLGLMFPQGGLEKLTSLQTLQRFETSKITKLGYLKDLNQLKSLTIVVSDQDEVEEAKKANLKNKMSLEFLGLAFKVNQEGEVNMDVADALQPPAECLQSLEIEITYIPKWTSILTNLKKLHLTLYNCPSPPNDQLYRLALLPSLEKLTLAYMNKMTHFSHNHLKPGPNSSVFSPSVDQDVKEMSSNPLIIFPELKELMFNSCFDWLEWEDIEEEEENNNINNDTVSIFPLLESLKMHGCPRLKALPYRLLRKASSLKSLEIVDCHNLQRRYKQMDGEDGQKISYIPHIKFS